MARAHDFGPPNPSSEPQKWVFFQHLTFQKHIKITKIVTPLIFFQWKLTIYTVQLIKNGTQNGTLGSVILCWLKIVHLHFHSNFRHKSGFWGPGVPFWVPFMYAKSWRYVSCFKNRIVAGKLRHSLRIIYEKQDFFLIFRVQLSATWNSGGSVFPKLLKS